MSMGNDIGQGKATIAAAKTASKASMFAALLQQKQYKQGRADLAPWRTAGGEAVNKLWNLVQTGPGEYQKSPYYNFLMKEGTNALERGAAARGNLLSGQQQKSLVGYGKDLASMDYDNWLNNWYKSLTPYQSLAGLGSTTSIATGQLGANAAALAGGYINQAGQYRAAGQLGVGNTLANSMSSGGYNLGQIAQNVLSQYSQGNQGITQSGYAPGSAYDMNTLWGNAGYGGGMPSYEGWDAYTAGWY